VGVGSPWEGGVVSDRWLVFRGPNPALVCAFAWLTGEVDFKRLSVDTRCEVLHDDWCWICADVVREPARPSEKRGLTRSSHPEQEDSRSWAYSCHLEGCPLADQP
jgi:hypothetical protein